MTGCNENGERTTEFSDDMIYSEVKVYKGKPTIFINGIPKCPMFYALTDCPGGRWTWEEVPRHNIMNFSGIGITLFQIDLWIEHIWKEDGSFSIKYATQQIRGILDVCASAAIFIRLHINSPRWWNKKYPDECTKYADCNVIEEDTWGGTRRLLEDDLKPVPRHSFASERWIKTATQIIIKFLHNLSELQEGNRVAGIQIADGIYGEFHYWAFKDHEPDISQPMKDYFQKWLKRKYGNAERLQEAWGESYFTFDSVTIPSKEERDEVDYGIFKDPTKERKLCDYIECQHDCVVDYILYFCKIIKQYWPRPIITGAFYGYFLTLMGRQVMGGHLKLERLLSSSDIDYLCAPQAYNTNCRQIGGAGLSRSLVESCLLNNKLWLDEMDQATFLGNMMKGIITFDYNDSIASLRRNVSEPLIRGAGMWFYDFGPTNTSGWWDHPKLLEEIGQLKEILNDVFHKDYVSVADVLLVYDTECFYFLGNSYVKDPITDQIAVNIMIPAMYRTGVSIDAIHICDLYNVDYSKYRVVIFGNTYFLTQSQIEFIQNEVAKDRRHLIWSFAPGFTDGDRLSSERVSMVTGIQLKEFPVSQRPIIEIKEAEFGELVYGLDDTFSGANPVIYNVSEKNPLKPFFIVEDDKAHILGRLRCSGNAALVKKKMDSYTSWFSSIPLTDSSVIRVILTLCDVHVYNNHNDAFFCNNNIICLHSKEGGRRSISLLNGKKIEIELNPRTTVLIDANDGNILLK